MRNCVFVRDKYKKVRNCILNLRNSTFFRDKYKQVRNCMFFCENYRKHKEPIKKSEEELPRPFLIDFIKFLLEIEKSIPS